MKPIKSWTRLDWFANVSLLVLIAYCVALPFVDIS